MYKYICVCSRLVADYYVKISVWKFKYLSDAVIHREGVLMKQIIILLGFVFLITGSLFANEQRLVGTWTSVHDNRVMVTINSNGTTSGWTLNVPGGTGNFSSTHWSAAGDKIVLYTPNGHRGLRGFRISSDGRTLIIFTNVQRDNFEWWGTAFTRN